MPFFWSRASVGYVFRIIRSIVWSRSVLEKNRIGFTVGTRRRPDLIDLFQMAIKVAFDLSRAYIPDETLEIETNRNPPEIHRNSARVKIEI